MAEQINKGDQKPRKPRPPKAAKPPAAELTKPQATPNPQLLTEPTTGNPQPATEQMEVHHHPQLEHKPKPWKEYLLEYCMIFLAVMTGFFAESYREHLSDRSKEREYVVNIKKDLVIELDNLNIWIPSLDVRITKFDTLISYLETQGLVKNGGNMYYLARQSTRNGIFEPNDNTLLEMKSSGNLRLLRSRAIVNNLMNMERLLQQYRNLLDIEGKEDVLSYPLLGQLFDASIFDKMVGTDKKSALSEKEYAVQNLNILKHPPGNPQLIDHDKVKINLLIYYLHQRKSSLAGEIHQLIGLKQFVEKLIKQVDDEYNPGKE